MDETILTKIIHLFDMDNTFYTTVTMDNTIRDEMFKCAYDRFLNEMRRPATQPRASNFVNFDDCLHQALDEGK